LVNLFESYDDARTCERLTDIYYKSKNAYNGLINSYHSVLKYNNQLINLLQNLRHYRH